MTVPWKLYLRMPSYCEEEMVSYANLGFKFKPFDCSCGKICYEPLGPIDCDINNLDPMFNYEIYPEDRTIVVGCSGGSSGFAK